MSEDTTDTTGTEPDEVDTTTDTTDTEETEPEWTPPDKAAWDKIKAKADKAAERDKLLRAAQAEIKALKGGADKPAEPSEADKLREGMKRTAARTALVSAGVTDKADQATLLDVLKLDAVELDDDGEPDTDELETRLAELRRILGAPAPGKRTPRVDTRDKGGRNMEPTNPDQARWRRIMGAG